MADVNYAVEKGTVADSSCYFKNMTVTILALYSISVFFSLSSSTKYPYLPHGRDVF